MLNPLRSEDEAFKTLLWFAGLVATIVIIVIVVRALS
jgi:hypothetical protein